MDTNTARSAENEEEQSISAAMSKTTTISTIAVQSGKTRIVIALLHYVILAATLAFVNAGYLHAPAPLAYSAPLITKSFAAPVVTSYAAPAITSYSAPSLAYSAPSIVKSYAAPSLAYSAPAFVKSYAAPALAYSARTW